MMRWLAVVGVVLVLGMAGSASLRAQENLDEGKSAIQLFNASCAVCHDRPQGLARDMSGSQLQDFLRQHYTASRETATELARFLDTLGGAPGGRRRPVAREAPVVPEASPLRRRAEEPAKPEPRNADAAKPETRPETKPERREAARPSRQREDAAAEKKKEADRKEPAETAKPAARRAVHTRDGKDVKDGKAKEAARPAAAKPAAPAATAAVPAGRAPVLVPMTADRKPPPAAPRRRVDSIAD